MEGPDAPRRRTADARPPRPALIAPTPPAAAPGGGEELVRSIELALDQARRGRRHVTLVALAAGGVPGDGSLEALAELVRNTVRSGDGLWRDGEAGLALLLADVDGLGVEPVLARMRLRLRGLTPRVRMGRAAAAPGIGAGDLLDLARADRDGG